MLAAAMARLVVLFVGRRISALARGGGEVGTAFFGSALLILLLRGRDGR
jgi:hypothetical protein